MKKIIIISVVIIALGIGVYFYVKSKSINTKEKAIAVIAEKTGTAASAFQAMGEGYLISRAKAIKSGSETFEDSGNTYLTQTGKSV